MRPRSVASLIGLAAAAMALGEGLRAQLPYPAVAQIKMAGIEVVVEDFATAPLSGRTRRQASSEIDFGDLLSRISMLRSEPREAPLAASRLFVADLNRSLYIVDRATKAFTEYLNLEEVFPAFSNRTAHGVGLGAFVFDPGYAKNGKFYTVHAEITRSENKSLSNARLPGLILGSGYVQTKPIEPQGPVARHCVIVEWTDRNLANASFEGTMREVIRIGFSANSHTVADLWFNPAARIGDADYGNLYIPTGNGASDTLPQRLDTMVGKILRITPDTSLRPTDLLGAEGTYRIPSTGPDPNPFAASTAPAVRKEIYAYGLRNPQRMSWDAASGKVFIADIGEHAWEELNLLKKGANYGYSQREGTDVLVQQGKVLTAGTQLKSAKLRPSPDTVAVDGISEPVPPVYPVALYSHHEGDAIAGGFVYRGSRMPMLSGKYVFGDISTGRLFVTDVGALIAADDDDPDTVATIEELTVIYDSPHDAPDAGAVRTRYFDIVKDTYARRGGRVRDGSVLPDGSRQHITSAKDSNGVAYGGGRADIRLAIDGDGELYILSKGDGMIRTLVAARAVSQAD